MTGKAIPEKDCGLTTNPATTVAAEDEELSDIEVLGVVACGRTPSRECEARHVPATVDQEGEVRFWVRPIQPELLIPEPAICADFDCVNPAHVVHVQSKKVG